MTGFLRWGKRSRTKFNYQTFWFEEMKLPVVGEKEIIESAAAIPMGAFPPTLPAEAMAGALTVGVRGVYTRRWVLLCFPALPN